MSDERRERQALREAAERLGLQANGKAALPPEAQELVAMEPVARQCIFFLDLLRVLVPGMMNQLGLVGGVRFLGAFQQLLNGVESFRTQVLQSEGSGIVVAGPGDVPPAGPRTQGSNHG